MVISITNFHLFIFIIPKRTELNFVKFHTHTYIYWDQIFVVAEKFIFLILYTWNLDLLMLSQEEFKIVCLSDGIK